MDPVVLSTTILIAWAFSSQIIIRFSLFMGRNNWDILEHLEQRNLPQDERLYKDILWDSFGNRENGTTELLLHQHFLSAKLTFRA